MKTPHKQTQCNIKPQQFIFIRESSKLNKQNILLILYSVDRAFCIISLNETNLVHYLFLVYFVNFIYNLYMFRTSPGPSSGGTTVFTRHLVHVILYS